MIQKKFRAWDKIKKVMYSWEEMCNMELHMKSICPCPLSELNNTLWTWLQYTGLKDKNGKEIYEGDIVEWKYLNTWQRNEVKLVEGGFVSIMTAFKDDLNEMQNLSLISKLDCEIIGDIYQNPELIK